MYAEACNELANGESDPLVDDALAKLELVRDRARKSGDDSTVLPKITERIRQSCVKSYGMSVALN